MKKIIFSATLIAACFATKAQSSDPKEIEGVTKPYAPLMLTESTDTTNTAFVAVEKMPQPSGDIQEYLAKTIKYPKKAKESNIQGRVIAKFIVEKDGSITNATIVRSIGGGCDEETLRVINAMPKWTPGYQKGKAVRVYYTLPVSFRLTN